MIFPDISPRKHDALQQLTPSSKQFGRSSPLGFFVGMQTHLQYLDARVLSIRQGHDAKNQLLQVVWHYRISCASVRQVPIHHSRSFPKRKRTLEACDVCRIESDGGL